MAVEQEHRITDPRALKAVAHPLRARLLGSLRVDGPQTASQMGRRMGESSGSMSYHLRVLAQYGFIEETPQQPNARDRRWQARHHYTSWNDADFVDNPEGMEALRALRHRQLSNVINGTRRFEEERESWGPAWQTAAGHSDYAIRLTAEQLKRLRVKFLELIEEHRDNDDADAELVRVYLGAFPVNDTEY